MLTLPRWATAFTPIHTDSLETETPWPAFVAPAQTLGINSIVSARLAVGDRAVGALDIYSWTASAFTGQDQDLASLFAVEASTLMSGAEPVPASVNGTGWSRR